MAFDFKIRLEKDNAPKYLYFEGTMPSSEGGSVFVETNLPIGSIIDVSVLTNTSADVWVPPGYILSAEFHYNWFIDDSEVKIILHATSSGSIINKKFKMIVTYRI